MDAATRRTPPGTASSRNVVRVAEALVRLRQRTGTLMHLDIEPEPDCLIETSDELIEFFERRLLPDGGAAAGGVAWLQRRPRREAHLREHVRICLDCCHFAVEYEDPSAALDARASRRASRLDACSSARR